MAEHKAAEKDKPGLSKAAQQISDIGHLRDPQIIQEKIKDVYGFNVTLAYAEALAKFVREMIKLAGHPE